MGANVEITEARISDLSYRYGTNDVYTNADGKVYFWLPQNNSSSTSVMVTADSNDYTETCAEQLLKRKKP